MHRCCARLARPRIAYPPEVACSPSPVVRSPRSERPELAGAPAAAAIVSGVASGAASNSNYLVMTSTGFVTTMSPGPVATGWGANVWFSYDTATAQ